MTASCWKRMFLLALFIAVNFDEFVVASGGKYCPADEHKNWSYTGNTNGPDKWYKTFPDCGGNKQSPIDSVTKDVTEDSNMASVKLENYHKPLSKADIVNYGYTIQVNPNDGVNRTITICDDGQNKTYNLTQFHFHWRFNGSKGSDHTVNGESYPMEIHLVHKNGEDVAVVGILFEVEHHRENTELKKLISQFPEVRYKDDVTPLKSSLDLNKLLPENPFSCYRYLEIPPCSGRVVWSIAKKPIIIGENQIAEFRKLFSVTKKEVEDDRENKENCKISDNFRPLQPLNGRTVSCSRKDSLWWKALTR